MTNANAIAENPFEIPREILPLEALKENFDFKRLKEQSLDTLRDVAEQLKNSVAKLTGDKQKLQAEVPVSTLGESDQTTFNDMEKTLTLTSSENSELTQSGRFEKNANEEVFKEEIKSIYERSKDALKTAVDYLIVKPAEFTWEQMKEHPIITIAAILSLAGIWYFAPELTYGVSALAEKGSEVLGNTLITTLGPEGGSIVTKKAIEIVKEIGQMGKTVVSAPNS